MLYWSTVYTYTLIQYKIYIWIVLEDEQLIKVLWLNFWHFIFQTKLVPSLKPKQECTVLPQETCNLKFRSEKETQKGKMKNTKVQKSKIRENVKSNNRIIQKMRKCKIQKMWKCKENKRGIWESKKLIVIILNTN